jgi:hypothetical protein
MTADTFKDLLAPRTPPCISLYMPTMAGMPHASENKRRYDDLVNKATAELKRVFATAEAEQLLSHFRALGDKQNFMRDQDRGLAIFGSTDFFRYYQLPRTVREEVQVADSFHLKHLIRAHQFSGQYEVLCISQGNVTLYRGNQDGLRAVALRNVPRNIRQAVDTEPTGRTNSAMEPILRNLSGPDLEQFLRAVDKTVWEFHNRESMLPLILCAPERYHATFHDVSKNPNLLAEGIMLNPDAVEIDEPRIRAESWKIIEPYYREQIDKVCNEFGRAKAQREGSEDIAQVAEAATHSRVGTLLVDADKHVGGRLKPDGRIEFGDLSQPDFDDLLDDIAEQVMKTGGQVLVISNWSDYSHSRNNWLLRSHVLQNKSVN